MTALEIIAWCVVYGAAAVTMTVAVLLLIVGVLGFFGKLPPSFEN